MDATRTSWVPENLQMTGRLQRYFGEPPELVAALEPLPDFRNVLIHEYVTLDLERVVEALGRLDAIDGFGEAVRQIEASAQIQ